MKTAVFPGSFNPFHEGHANLIRKALCVFDRIIVAIGDNPEKSVGATVSHLQAVRSKVEEAMPKWRFENDPKVVTVTRFSGLLADYVNDLITKDTDDMSNPSVVAVVRGLRNSQDFEYEKVQQYTNEDLDMPCPTVYLISDRLHTHISSSQRRAIEKAKEKK